MMDSYWGYLLLMLLFIALLFVFFLTTPANEDEVRKR